ncbi:MAG: DUF4239 domain-containing protein [Kiritimatiellaeota bacterium]|nr:DUF4239 domain-containing protein [Kiritimatiellota bacterium]
MLKFLMNWPAEVNLALLAAISFAITAAGLKLVRGWRPIPDIRREHDVIGFAFQVVGLVYGVMLGFVLSMIWGQYSHTADVAAAEGVNLRILYYKSYALPATNQTPIRKALLEYAHAVAEDEWVTLRQAQESPRAQVAIMDLWKRYYTVQPTNEVEKIWLRESLNTLNETTSQRRMRMLAAEQSVPPILWELLICGGILTVCFMFIFGIERFRFLMTWALIFLILLILFIICELDNPFWGDPHIAPDAFLRFIAAHPTPD